jgi:hypothetical protein
MKYVLCGIFLVLMVSTTVLAAQANYVNLTADDIKFLKSYGIRDEDIKIIPELPKGAQTAFKLLTRKLPESRLDAHSGPCPAPSQRPAHARPESRLRNTANASITGQNCELPAFTND